MGKRAIVSGEPSLPFQVTPATSTRTVKAAAVQFVSGFGRPDRNRQQLELLVRQAAAGGADIVVIPEMAITGYASADLKTTWQLGDRPLMKGLRGVSPINVAETVPGKSTALFASLAKELGIYLTIPLVEYAPKTDQFFNTIILAGPDGELLLHYRKLNPWPMLEHGWATKGDRGLQYVDTSFGRIGLLVCYDIHFEPPLLRDAGVDLLLFSSAWVDTANSQWFTEALPEIARNNNFHIVGANRSVRRKPLWHGYGHSTIIDRTGKILVKAVNDIGDEILYAGLPVPESA